MAIEDLARSLTKETKLPENDLDRAYQALSGKLASYTEFWNYYDGDQPLMYTARRMRDLFADLELAKFVENWCAVVIDSALDRINLNPFTVENPKAQEQLNLDWSDYNLSLEADDVHEAALVVGESFIIVWEETDNEGKDDLQVFYNDPRLCHLFYESSNPRKKQYGAKWWRTPDGYTRMNLYYPDHLEYWRTRSPKRITNWKSFERFNPTDTVGGATVPNPYEEVPFFHFRLERRKVKSDLTNAIPLQNGINKLATDMMVSAEYGAFPQRWIISNVDTEALKNSPDEIWEIAAGDGMGQQTSVGQFAATQLENYIKAIDSLASTLAIISRTPKHYLFQQTGDPSGEALMTMEAPLTKRCSDHIQQFTPVWQDLARFILKVRGIDVEKKDIVVEFDDPATIQPKMQAEIRKLGIEAGIPLNTMLRDEGKDEAWIEQMEQDKKDAEGDVTMQTIMNEIRAGQNTEGEGDK